MAKTYVKETVAKVSEEDFVRRAIKALRKDGYKGINPVYSGLNAAFAKYFDKDPVAATKALAESGKIIAVPYRGKVPGRGGVVLYLPEEAPERRDTEEERGAKALATILS